MLNNRALEDDMALSAPGGRPDAAASENLVFVFVHGFQGWGSYDSWFL